MRTSGPVQGPGSRSWPGNVLYGLAAAVPEVEAVFFSVPDLIKGVFGTGPPGVDGPRPA